MSVYTLGLWHVKEGSADEFAAAWTAMAEATGVEFPGANGTLLRDRTDPNLFISFGPWQSLEQVAAWRESPNFQEGVAKMRDLLESFEPHTLDVASKIS